MPSASDSSILGTFEDRLSESHTATVTVKENDRLTVPELSYTLPVGDAHDHTYWISYTYETASDLLDVWFDNRVFNNHETARDVYDTLCEAGVRPDSDPVDRVLTDVDLDTIDLDETREVLLGALGDVARVSEPDSSVGQATGHVLADLRDTFDEVPRDVRRTLTSNAREVNQTIYMTEYHAKAARTLLNRADDAFVGADDPQFLWKVRNAIQVVFDAYMDAWDASSEFYHSLSDAGEELDAPDWASTHQDGYRDVFETGVEFMGHGIVHAQRQLPKLEAHILRRNANVPIR